jgi:hypothetical protein
MNKIVKYFYFSIYKVVFVITSLLMLVSCDGKSDPNNPSTDNSPPAVHVQDLQIPKQADWIDHGPILEKGKIGDWDYLLYGAFTGTVVKKDGTFYLYYQGAKEYSEKYGTVTYRAIGVATSQDGIHFVKFPDNPVLAWFPNNWLEEGAVSGGATLILSGEVVMYYGANTKQTEMFVNADGRLAVSTDGFKFTDHGVILDHKNNEVWGSGDELFPIIAFYDKGNWLVYYIPNGTQQKGKLGVAWGLRRNRLQNTGPALANGKTVNVWGTGGYAKIGTDTYALFLNNVRKKHMEVRFVHVDYPDRISKPMRSYGFENFVQGTVFLDHETNTWFMFYRAKGGERYHVKSAPVRKIDVKDLN